MWNASGKGLCAGDRMMVQSEILVVCDLPTQWNSKGFHYPVILIADALTDISQINVIRFPPTPTNFITVKGTCRLVLGKDTRKVKF